MESAIQVRILHEAVRVSLCDMLLRKERIHFFYPLLSGILVKTGISEPWLAN